MKEFSIHSLSSPQYSIFWYLTKFQKVLYQKLKMFNPTTSFPSLWDTDHLPKSTENSFTSCKTLLSWCFKDKASGDFLSLFPKSKLSVAHYYWPLPSLGLCRQSHPAQNCGDPGLAVGHSDPRGSGGQSTQRRLFWLLHYFLGTLWGWIQTIFLAGGLARRHGSLITPSTSQYRGISVPEGDSRTPRSFQWYSSLEPPKISGS